jgi:NADH-quinone oxidoreductase subunit C
MSEAKDVKQTLIDTFGDSIEGSEEFRGELTILVKAEKIVEVAQFCRDGEGLKFNLLSDIAGIDYYPDEPRFGLCYHLYSFAFNRRLRLKVLWSDGDAPVPSLTVLWPSANYEEREAYDMFGILFAGHPDLRRILMPDDWQGFPQRKDHPLGYETVQFSFNYDEIAKRKPFAKK